jgi:NADPH2:quinone reductase
MRASVIHAFGPPSVLGLENVPDPQPGSGQVAIDVEVASITFVETQIRAGKPPNPAMLPTLPAILGNGVGGTVVRTGHDVDSRLLGRRVISALSGSGGYAERAVASASALIEVPSELATPTAAALLADGRTALLLVDAVRPRPGETVLVEAAAGGVGSLLVQLAHAAGARVVAAASGPAKLDLARELGADAAVDDSDDVAGWFGQLAGDGIDVVFDGVGGGIGRAAFDAVRRGGRFCTFGMASGASVPVEEHEAAARGVELVRGPRPTPEQQRAAAHTALHEAVAGRLRPIVGQIFDLAHAADAHAAIEARATLGKTLLDPKMSAR